MLNKTIHDSGCNYKTKLIYKMQNKRTAGIKSNTLQHNIN